MQAHRHLPRDSPSTKKGPSIERLGGRDGERHLAITLTGDRDKRRRKRPALRGALAIFAVSKECSLATCPAARRSANTDAAMKLVTWNVNGIRSVYGKGFTDYLATEKPDVICLQEVKCATDELSDEIQRPRGYRGYWHAAEKKGYSGVALYSRKEPLAITGGMGDPEIDREGRVLVAEFTDFVLVNAYFPNSQRSHQRLPYKLEFCNKMLAFMESWRARGKGVVVCGDYNIAHQEIDLRNPKSNMKNAGFLPEERAWMDKLVGAGYVDTFRHFNKEPGHYTWWSYRPGVREKNIGWRLDHFFANREMSDRLKAAHHRPEVKGSDHCPVVLELKR
jgi:exodeoxyribonuclease-3